MYTATIKTKEALDQGVRVTVTFSDGTKSFDEVIVPQTKSQFHSWVEGRLFTLNEGESMKTDLAVEREVQPEPTQAEKDFEIWLRKMNRLNLIKANLIDTGVFTGNEAAIVALRDDIRATFKPAYLNQL